MGKSLSKFGLAISLLFITAISPCAQNNKQYKISDLHISEYSKYTGSLAVVSKAEDDKERFNALNISLLVAVEISGRIGSYPSNKNVLLTAYSNGKLVFRGQQKMGLLNDNGKYYLPFFLHGPFCSPVTIKAQIVAPKTRTSTTRKLWFGCGE